MLTIWVRAFTDFDAESGRISRQALCSDLGPGSICQVYFDQRCCFSAAALTGFYRVFQVVSARVRRESTSVNLERACYWCVSVCRVT